MNMSERPLNKIGFSWNQLRQKSSAQQPTSEEQPKKQKNKVPHMKRRRLTADMITVHNKANCRTVTLNKVISERAYHEGMSYAYIGDDNKGNGIYIVLTTESGNGSFHKLSFNTKNKQSTGIVSNYSMVQQICEYFGQPEGDYYFKIEDIQVKDPLNYIALKITQIIDAQPLEPAKEKRCPKCGRMLPMSEFYTMTSRPDGHSSYCKECNREHGRLRNGTTGEYRANPTISEATDNQLYDELKRRGYDGKLTRTSTLE